MLQKGMIGKMAKPKVLKAIVGVSRDTTQHWNAYPDFIPRLGEVIAYLDRFVITDASTGTRTLVPDIKVGDSVHRLIDLPFVGDRGPEEITRSEIIQILQSASITSNANDPENPNYTPEGIISKPNINLSYSIQDGVAARCTMPELDMNVTNETLNITWSDGSFTANTPTSIRTINAELAGALTFTGKPTEINVNYTGV